MSSAIYSGVVKHNPLEGGFWELVTDGGASYQLRGVDVKALKNGARFEVHGSVDEGGMGIGMSGGAFLDVVRVQKLLPQTVVSAMFPAKSREHHAGRDRQEAPRNRQQDPLLSASQGQPH